MNKTVIYQSLPYPLKAITASTWGYYLHWLRYGKETEKLVDETLERETWTITQWNTWREERLANILHRAATTVPYYREQWLKRRIQGDKSSWEYLENWPKLDKTTVRENPKQFLSDRVKGKHLHSEYTSGTTGKPTKIYLSKDVIRQWYAIFEARIKRWFGLTYNDRWGIFGGKKIISLAQRNPPYWVWNQGLNQVYFSIYHISQKTVKDYVEALWHYSPEFLIVYPSSLATLSKFILEEELVLPKLSMVISNAESVTVNYRKLIQDAFNCPVVETYGMVELLSAYSQCPHKTLHLWPEVGYLEIYDADIDLVTNVSENSGLFCFTSLLNKDMPLIRYINGDIGRLPDWNSVCPCGRSLPVMSPILGRSKDLIHTKDGRELYILDSLYIGLPIIEGQLIQNELNKFEVKIIRDRHYNRPFVEKEIKKRLIQYLGNVEFILTEVEEINRDASGKFRPFISKLNRIEPK